jgi:putative transposase
MVALSASRFVWLAMSPIIFYSLKEARIVIEQWRKHYNTIRPHSSLGYRPPAPQTSSPFPEPLDQAAAMQ